jgi:hypothetical protein
VADAAASEERNGFFRKSVYLLAAERGRRTEEPEAG